MMNKTKPPKYPDQSNRLRDYDYRLPGAHFITLVTQKRQPLFGRLIGETIELSLIGQLVREEWIRTGTLRPQISLDAYAIMPDHFHAILFINEQLSVKDPLGAHRSAHLQREPGSLGSIVASFKSAVTLRAKTKIWQRNYYDRIVRNEEELDRIRNYVHYNPLLLNQSREEIWRTKAPAE